jgi:hypothetical protein
MLHRQWGVCKICKLIKLINNDDLCNACIFIGNEQEVNNKNNKNYKLSKYKIKMR